ncbi:hypothetical protein ABT186_44570 [Streptomyces sp. NPDC001634]|uniref:hypothetical protein n=1 Tax=Streptomyces sp. NPDC001634 TaxID=3154390 RepID=UPI00332FC403
MAGRAGVLSDRRTGRAPRLKFVEKSTRFHSGTGLGGEQTPQPPLPLHVQFAECLLVVGLASRQGIFAGGFQFGGDSLGTVWQHPAPLVVTGRSGGAWIRGRG